MLRTTLRHWIGERANGQIWVITIALLLAGVASEVWYRNLAVRILEAERLVESIVETSTEQCIRLRCDPAKDSLTYRLVHLMTDEHPANPIRATQRRTRMPVRLFAFGLVPLACLALHWTWHEQRRDDTLAS